MNNQQNGYIFAEKFNSESINYGTGFNPLRGKGYSASILDLVFDEQFYGDPRYGPGGAEYGGSSDGYYIRWMFTSSLTQSFYDANPSISEDEVLFVLYQNYIPTGSSNPTSSVQYALYIPLNPTDLPYAPSTISYNYVVSGEFYFLGQTGVTDGTESIVTLRISTGSGVISTTSPTTPTTTVYTKAFNVPADTSGSFNLTVSGSSPQIVFSLNRRSLITGSFFILRNLKITYPVDISNFEPFAQTQDLHLQTSTGMINARYEGCKMTSPDFNIDSPDTVDGGPVVTVTTVNPKGPVVGDLVPRKKTSQSVKSTSNLTGKGNFKIK